MTSADALTKHTLPFAAGRRRLPLQRKFAPILEVGRSPPRARRGGAGSPPPGTRTASLQGPRPPPLRRPPRRPSAGRRPHLARGLPRPLRRHGARLGGHPALKASNRAVGWWHGRAALLLPAFPPSERTPGSASQKRARPRPAPGRKCAGRLPRRARVGRGGGHRRRRKGPRTTWCMGPRKARTSSTPEVSTENQFTAAAFLPADSQ